MIKNDIYIAKQDTPIARTILPGMDKLFEWGIIKEGDIVVIKNIDNSQATVIDAKYVDFDGKNLHLIYGDKRLLDGLQFQ